MIAAQRTTTGASGAIIDSRYYLAPVAGVGWLAGIGLGSLAESGVLAWLALAIPFTLGAVLLWRRGRMGLALAAFVALALGGARYSAARPAFDATHVSHYNGANTIVALGTVISEPSESDTRSQLQVKIHELVVDDQPRPVSGVILVQTGRYPPIRFGASLRLTGDLDAPEQLGSSGFAAYLERQGVFSVMEYPQVDILSEGGGSSLMRALIQVRDRGRRVISVILPEPHAALLTGILLGDDSGMPRSLQDDFLQTGMTHIIAISGFNIAVLIALLDRVTGPILPRRPAAIIIMIFLVLYALLIGAGALGIRASVVRATIMGIAYLAGLRLMGRPTMAVAGLFVAAFLITLAQPQALWDVGFQLSFAATLGLMLYARPWTRWFSDIISPYLMPGARGKVIQLVTDVVIVTLAAQVLTLPLILFHFGRLSLASLPANFLVLPAQPGVMVTGGVALLLGFIHPYVGQLAGLIAWLFLNYTITIIRLLAGMPGASVPLELSSRGLAAIYLSIAALTLLAATNRGANRAASNRGRFQRRTLVALAGLAIIAVLALAWMMDRPDGRLHVAFLDVGQGDATFIQTPVGRQMLIDGGRYPSAALDQLGRQMPFWDRSIDIVMATHPDVDHVAGLVSVVERYNVAYLITNGADGESDPVFGALLTAAEENGVTVKPAQMGEIIHLDDGVRLEILHVGPVGASDNRNDASIVALLTYGDLTVLLTGDAGTAAEDELLRSGRIVDSAILKAGHHGANSSSSEDFLRAVSPGVVIISAGRDNSYGHPHPAMLDRATAVGATILRTDLMGTLEVQSDGRQMWWEAERVDRDSLLP